jgi:hypothetical protein
MLARVVGECWHALVRDVIALGFRRQDMFTTLDLSDMIAIVVGAPPTSSVRYFLDQGWSREAHLLANLQEQNAGMGQLNEPYPRPGIEARERDPMEGKFFPMEPMTWEEADRRDAARYAAAAAGKPKGRTRKRTYSASGVVL